MGLDDTQPITEGFTAQATPDADLSDIDLTLRKFADIDKVWLARAQGDIGLREAVTQQREIQNGLNEQLAERGIEQENMPFYRPPSQYLRVASPDEVRAGGAGEPLLDYQANITPEGIGEPTVTMPGQDDMAAASPTLNQPAPA